MGSEYSRERLITCNETEIADLITKNFGTPYSPYRDIIIHNNITGEVLSELKTIEECTALLDDLEIRYTHKMVFLTRFKKIFLSSELEVKQSDSIDSMMKAMTIKHEEADLIPPPPAPIKTTNTPLPPPIPPLLPQSRPFTVFLTHDWGKDELDRPNHDRVSRVNRALKGFGINTWFDEERMQEGNIRMKMAEGVDQASAMIVFVTNRYASKVNGSDLRDNCKVRKRD